MQLINVASGGSLYQDLKEQLPGSLKHDYFPFNGSSFTRDYLAHAVEVAPGTRLAELFGAGKLPVNSMHHQGVKDIGAGLVPSAVAPDGLVEAIEGTGEGYVFAVQWHPEALTDGDAQMRALFTDFVGEAARWRREVGLVGSSR